MAANYDPRVASAFAALGYDLFPFSAFDDAGRPLVDDLAIPARYKEAVGRIASTPAWSEIYRAMSVLDDPEWGCYMAGIAFVGNDVRVAIFKSIGSVATAEAAHEWSVSYSRTVEQTISDYAGRSHLVDQSWVKTLNEVIGILPQQEKAGDPAAGQAQGSTDPAGKTPGGGNVIQLAGVSKPLLFGPPAPVAATAKDQKALPAAAPQASTLGAPPLFMLALRVMAAILSNLTKRTYVRSTIFWYTPGTLDVDLAWAEGWKPLHTDHTTPDRRSVHAIWNAQGPKAQRPSLIRGNPAWRGSSVVDMPHDLEQWCRAFYPTANCETPVTNADGSVANVAVAQVSQAGGG